MFELSANIKGDTHDPGSGRTNRGKMAESFGQKIICCPSILTGMSREMRTQMNAIVAYSYLLNKKEYSDKEKEQFSNQIYSSCEQLVSLFDNFLDSAIIDTGNSKSESGICSPDKIFNELFSEFRGILKKERYSEVILVCESENYSNAEYSLDASRLTRVIRNLFHIALDNTKSGYIKVGYYFRDDNLTFFILDSGQGFLKCREFLQSRDMNRSLSKFNDTFTAVYLALTRKLVQMMNGSICIKSNGLSGSGVYFSVPVTAEGNFDDPVDKFSNTISTF
jgi:signal transduction histidine kinase